MEMSVGFPHLGIFLDHVERSVSLFGFPIAWYGIIFAVAILVGVWFVVLKAKRTAQDQDFYLEMLLVALVMALIGARVYYVIFSWDFYSENLEQIWNIRGGGLAGYGALFGGILGAFLFCKWKKADFGLAADTCCQGLVIGQMISTWGGFFSRENLGDYTDSLLAVQIPASAVSPDMITDRIREHLVQIDQVEYIQVHPVFLYEFLWCLGLWILLSWYRRRAKFHGELFLLYLTLYSVGKIWMEGLRTDSLLYPGTEIPVAQMVAIFLVVICLVMIIVRRKVAGKRAELSRRRKEERLQNENRRQTVGEDTSDAEGTQQQNKKPEGSSELPGAEPGTGQTFGGIPEREERGQEIEEK